MLKSSSLIQDIHSTFKTLHIAFLKFNTPAPNPKFLRLGHQNVATLNSLIALRLMTDYKIS